MFLSIYMYIDIHISPLCFNIYIYTLLEREERSIYAMSRNPRVCPAQINVWCCAEEIGYIIVWASTDSLEA